MIAGFIDAHGQQVTFEQVFAGEGYFTTDAGAPIPRPVVRACARGYRAGDHYGDADVVSVTSLIAPPQQKILEQRHDLYVRPTANLWAVYGTIAHGIFENETTGNDIQEVKLVIERQGVKIGGTFDLLEHMDGTLYQGRDYKVVSGYGVKKMVNDGVYKGHEEYFWQAQMYAMMVQDPDVKIVREVEETGKMVTYPWERRGKIAIDNWGLVAIARDWTARMAVHFGPIELIDVPLIAQDRLENWLSQRLLVWQASKLASDEGLPNCTSEETWGGRRCLDWCASAPVCHQLHPELGVDMEAELAGD